MLIAVKKNKFIVSLIIIFGTLSFPVDIFNEKFQNTQHMSNAI